MALQNFVDLVGPVANSAWMNNIDQAINGTAAGQGSALIPHLPPGTGAVATNVGAWANAQIVNVPANFSTVDPTGVADSTTPMQAAANLGVLCYYPNGTYKFSSLTMAAGGIRGSGAGQTKFVTSSATADAITWNGAGEASYSGTLVGPHFEGFSISASVTRTAGAFIKIAPSTGEISFSYFRDLYLFAPWDGINFVAASHFTVDGCKIINWLNTGITVANTNDADSGDSTICNCLLNSGAVPTGQGAAIYQTSSGGLRIVNNKFLGGKFHYYMAAVLPTKNVGDLVIGNNSLENCTSQSLTFTRLSGTFSWGGIEITGNQFGSLNINVIVMNDPSGFLSDVTFVGNKVNQLGSSGAGLLIDHVSQFSGVGNTLSGSGGTTIGFSVGASATNVRLANNPMFGVNTPYITSSSSIMIDGHQTGTGTSTSTTAYGSYFYTLNLITFPLAYDVGNNPAVSASITGGTGGGIWTWITGVSNTGFTLWVFGTSNNAVQNIPYQWWSH